MWFRGQILFIFIIVGGFTIIQAVLNFRDENYNGNEADRYNWANHPCRRDCKDTGTLTCHYVFVVEKLSSMSKACYDCPFNVTDCFRPHCMPTDGDQRTLYTVNRQLPGPTIEVCQNDTIVVEVRNLMLAETTTIHWHGIKQRDTQFMDGVPYITQCPILPGEQFTYVFLASTHGTYFYHSHIGEQRATGLFGALIIHPMPKYNTHIKMYDYDNHYMLVNEWNQLSGMDSTIKEFNYDGLVNMATLLINGLGRYRQFQRNNVTAYVPSTVFNVQQNKRFRFRLIEAGSGNCPVELSIDNHPLQIISLDSRDIEPVVVDTITIWAGERVDFIINATQPIGNYWIRARGLGLCRVDNTTGANQVAILRYAGARIEDPRGLVGYSVPLTTPRTRVLNPYNIGTEGNPLTNLNIPLLTSMYPNDEALLRKPDYQQFINFDFYPLDNYDYHRKNLYGFNQVPEDRRIGSLQFNHISFKFPPFPLQTQWEMITPSTLCNSTSVPRNCTTEHCACTHVLKFKLNTVVELIFVDEGRFAQINHPLHLHGFFFRVVAVEKLQGNVTVERIKELDRQGKINRRLDHAPLKDTIKAPSGGYTIVRFYADNPGFWYFHCHFDPHDDTGMALVVQVGEYQDYARPPQNFPTCKSFIPAYM